VIAANPFAEMRGLQVASNPKRDAYVERDTIRRALDACPTLEWRLIIVLGRFAGLRLPSEIVGLRWSDVHWDRHFMLVRSPKTEHHSGGDERMIPIFPDLYPTLRAAYDAAAGSEGPVIATPHYRHPKANLRTPLLRILRDAGIEPWPSLFQNLRKTCATELVEAGHPEWKVCRWLGHSDAIGRKHYRSMTEADFAEASQRPAPVGSARLKSGSAPGRMGPHRPAEAEMGRDRNCGISGKDQNSKAKPLSLNYRTVPRLGLEPRTL